MKKKQTMNTKKRSPIIDLHFCLQRGYWQVGNSRPQGNKQRVIERKWASCAQVQTQYSLYCNNEEETCSPVACSLQPSGQVVLKSKHSTLCNNEKEACSAARSLNEGALCSLCFWITLFVRKPAACNQVGKLCSNQNTVLSVIMKRRPAALHAAWMRVPSIAFAFELHYL